MFKLKNNAHYAIVTVMWEYSYERFVIEVQYSEPEMIDVEAAFEAQRPLRDEGYKIVDFTMIEDSGL